MSVNRVFGEELRVVDLTRDEVSYDRRHSVYRGRISDGCSTWASEFKRTLGIEEDGSLREVWPLEHAPQLRNILLSVRSHCRDELSAQDTSIPPSPLTPTLLIIADEYHFPYRRLVLGQDWQVIPNPDLTRFVDDNGLNRDDPCKPTLHDPAC